MTLWNLVRIGLVLVVGGLIYTHHAGHRWSDAVTAIPRAGAIVSSAPSAPTCNPTKLDPAAERYADRVTRALADGAASDALILDPGATRAQRMARYLRAAHARERVVRAIDSAHPDEFPLA